MATSSTINVLLVEDSRTDVLLAEYSLSAGNFHIRNGQRLAEALKLLEVEQFDVVLLDLGLPDSQGLDTLRTLRKKTPHVAVVVLTGRDDEELALEALQEGAQDYLVKGQIQEGTLQRAVRYALERSRSEEALRESEELFRSAFEDTGVAMGLTNMDNRFVRVNSSLSQLLGYSRDELLTMSVRDVTHPDDLAETYDRLKQILAGPYNYFQMEKRYIHKSGRVLWGLTNISLVQDLAGEAVCYVGQIQDVTARKLTESTLRLRERAIQAVSQGILITDANRPDNPIIYASTGFEKLTGYTAAEVIGRNCRFLQGKDTDQASVSHLREALREGGPCTVEILNYRKDGSPFWNALSVSPVLDDGGNVSHFVGVQSDVTERRKLEVQLRQSQKMEAIGSLAGGVAHDFNNLLTIINGYSEAIEKELPLESNVRNMAQEIREAGVRAASLTRQLLVFSRNQVLEPKVFNLNDVVVRRRANAPQADWRGRRNSHEARSGPRRGEG
jgi:two-component system, cell cycle sensor histidine kinase and response regulator CckA